MTITDAMAAGKPVIATGWSGNMDFMNVRNSFPVRYDLIKIEKGVGPYREGEEWADPSVEHAAELMRHVFEDRADAIARGQAAQREIESGFSTASIARLIQERLNAIAVRRKLAAFKQETWTAFLSYQTLVGRIVDTVRRVVPHGARVLVVSKGDERLVRITGYRVEHFPQACSGVYAGYHPADSAAAIEHLKELQARGAQYLLLPSSSFWWLDYYDGFWDYVGAFSRVWDAEDCIIYRLDDAKAGNPAPRSRLHAAAGLEPDAEEDDAVWDETGSPRGTQEPD